MSDYKKKPESYWREKLTSEQYSICREKQTEPPFTGELLDCDEEGNYLCFCCQIPLFSSKTKFDSGSGWPSFYDAINNSSNIETKVDLGNLMIRTEVLCKNCGSHLGHVFDDGPNPTGKRFCVNSISLEFKKDDEK